MMIMMLKPVASIFDPFLTARFQVLMNCVFFGDVKFIVIPLDYDTRWKSQINVLKRKLALFRMKRSVLCNHRCTKIQQKSKIS